MEHEASGESDLEVLVASLSPVLNGGSYVFVHTDGDAEGWAAGEGVLEDAVATVVEPEGRTLVLPRERAESLGLRYGFVSSWITLQVHSALEAVGLTAAVASALAEAGISANVVAGYYHDHVFVPEDRREDAMAALHALAGGRRAGGPG